MPTEIPTVSPTGSSSDQIALGVGLGIGLPTLIVGLLAWCYPPQRWNRKSMPESAAPLPMLPVTPTASMPGNPPTCQNNNHAVIPVPPRITDRTQQGPPHPL